MFMYDFFLSPLIAHGSHALTPNTMHPIHGFSPLHNNNNLQLYRSAYCMPHERRLRNCFPSFFFSLFLKKKKTPMSFKNWGRTFFETELYLVNFFLDLE